MELLAQIIRAVLDAWEQEPEALTELTLLQGIDPGHWYVHVAPDLGYFACVTWLKNYGMAVSTHDYLEMEGTP